MREQLRFELFIFLSLLRKIVIKIGKKKKRKPDSSEDGRQPSSAALLQRRRRGEMLQKKTHINVRRIINYIICIQNGAATLLQPGHIAVGPDRLALVCSSITFVLFHKSLAHISVLVYSETASQTSLKDFPQKKNSVFSGGESASERERERERERVKQ